MGYSGGVGAFHAMARGYGVVVPDSRARQIRDGWRVTNPWAPRLWDALEQAAKRAVVSRKPQWFDVGRVSYGRIPGGPLVCRLPSGRLLYYPEPRMEGDRLTVLKGSWTAKVGDPEWPRVDLYGGLLAENVTQAVSADILGECMERLEPAGWPIAGHTHDEILLEVPEEQAEAARGDLEREMLTLPGWGGGLPLGVEIWIGPEYKK